MPHLHLPVDHTDADLVLAVNLAQIVGSEDLYVAWSYESGAGAIPEVEAELREQHARGGFIGAVAAGFGAFWRALIGRAADDAVERDGGTDPAHRPAERPYAD